MLTVWFVNVKCFMKRKLIFLYIMFLQPQFIAETPNRLYSIHTTTVFLQVRRIASIFSVHTTTDPYSQSGHFNKCSIGIGVCFRKLKTVAIANSSSTNYLNTCVNVAYFFRLYGQHKKVRCFK
jgi:hypothetical protein